MLPIRANESTLREVKKYCESLDAYAVQKDYVDRLLRKMGKVDPHLGEKHAWAVLNLAIAIRLVEALENESRAQYESWLLEAGFYRLVERYLID